MGVGGRRVGGSVSGVQEYFPHNVSRRHVHYVGGQGFPHGGASAHRGLVITYWETDFGLYLREVWRGVSQRHGSVDKTKLVNIMEKL